MGVAARTQKIRLEAGLGVLRKDFGWGWGGEVYAMTQKVQDALRVRSGKSLSCNVSPIGGKARKSMVFLEQGFL